MNKKRKFIKIFKVPPLMEPYIDKIVTEDELKLVLASSKKPLSAKEVAKLFDFNLAEAEQFLKKAYERHVVNKLVDGKVVGYVFDNTNEKGKQIKYIPANFHARLESITMYEGWKDVPKDVQKKISYWWVESYAEKVRPIVEKIKKDPNAYRQIKNKDFLLLDEALEQVETAKTHAVLNCDCRCAEKACSFMTEACIRFDEGAKYTLKRGLGRKISKKECKDIIIKANRQGLMQTGTKDWKGKGLFGICNCCSCCCNPIRAAKILDSEKIYPRTHYSAKRDADKCINCGICVKRCPFGAFYYEKDKDGKKILKLNKEKCYGCGVCLTGCPTNAIKMLPINNEKDKNQ